MMNLLVDSGNTRLKWALLQDGGFVTGQALVNQQITRHELVETWNMLTPPEHLAIACVSSSPSLELVLAVAVELWPAIKIVQIKSEVHAFGVHNAYQQPEKLGVDRWLALVAVHNLYHKPACIVDCGTAITVDLIDADGKHQGGLISPGLTLMKKSLAAGTAALEFHETKYDVGPANHTEAAIYSGTLAAAVGLIEHVLNRQSDPMSVILTGGDADIIARQLAIKPIVDPDLVMSGLAIVLEARL
jgi:type III pantothenate kinase